MHYKVVVFGVKDTSENIVSFISGEYMSGRFSDYN